MIDPFNVTNYYRSDAELEEWWLFSTLVAGKTAVVQARLLERFLNSLPGSTPFQKIKDASENGTLLHSMKHERVGQYSRLERCWKESLSLDLRNDPLEKFESVYGVGPKTARMFLMHSRRNQPYAALDTHILKYLDSQGWSVPKTTPSGKKYAELEKAFLYHAAEHIMTPADFDLMIWKRYSTKTIDE